MSDGNGKSVNGTGRPGSVLAAAPLRRTMLPVLESADSPKLLMNCATCRKGGDEIINWTTNRRRCPAYMDDSDGRCFYELRNLAVPFDRDEPPTSEGWLADMREKFHVIGQEIMLELQLGRALGVRSDPRIIAAGIRMLGEMHDVFKNAQRMDLFAKAINAADGDTGAALRRLCSALALDDDVRREAIDGFSGGDEQLGDILRRLVDAVAERNGDGNGEDAVEVLPDDGDDSTD